jgi:hypothetical protein
MKTYQRSCLLLALECLQTLRGRRIDALCGRLVWRWREEAAALLQSLDGLGGVW